MTKQELIEFLRENLKVEVKCGQREVLDSTGVYVVGDIHWTRVKIVLDGEVISESSGSRTLSINEDTNTYYAR